MGLRYINASALKHLKYKWEDKIHKQQTLTMQFDEVTEQTTVAEHRGLHTTFKVWALVLTLLLIHFVVLNRSK